MWYWLIGAFIIGMGVFGFGKPLFTKIVRRFRERAPLIRKYWLIVIPFIILTTVAYVLLFLFANTQTNFEILGQVSALVLAIFVGYIGFAEWSKSKFDGLATQAQRDLEQGRFLAALVSYEEANRLQPKDLGVLGNLLEIYLFVGRNEKFDQKIEHYKSLIVEESDLLKYHFLKAERYLLDENLKEAKEAIRKGIEFVANHLDLRPKFGWSISDTHNSEPYSNLNATTKRMLDNYHAYLGGTLPPSREASFLSGQYDTQDVDMVNQ